MEPTTSFREDGRDLSRILNRTKYIKSVKIFEFDTKHTDEINDISSQIESMLSALKQKSQDALMEDQKKFSIAFKNKMYEIKQEMLTLKEHASFQKMQLKHDQRLIDLESERDWFRKECLKLDKMCREYQRVTLSQMKSQIEHLAADKDFYQTQLFRAKRVNKALILELEKANGGLVALSEMETSTDKILSLQCAEETELDEGSKRRGSALQSDYKEVISSAQQERAQTSRSSQRTKDMSHLVDLESNHDEVRELRYTETIRHLNQQMDVMKKSIRKLKKEKVNQYSERNELEEFFLSCIDEVRKEILKRRAIFSKRSQKHLTKASLQMIEGQAASKVNLTDFTSTDRRKVIELRLSNESVLMFLYDKLFPRKGPAA